jgi:Putative peptidoglycan binding domain/HNH endonuclease/Bacterial SH3 domain
LPHFASHKKNGLKLAIIAFYILISFLLSYAENHNKDAESGVTVVNKINSQFVLAKSDISRDVKQIQTLLALLKFNPGPIDGILGNKTVQAIRAFQLDIGVPVTGKIDENLKSQLDSAYKRVVIRSQEQKKDDEKKPSIRKKKPKLTVSQDVKLYSEPGLKGLLVGEAKQGTKFTAICKTDNWFLVTTKENSNCWIHKDWITINSQVIKDVKTLVECDNLRALKQLATKRAKESELGEKPEVKPQQETEMGSKTKSTSPPSKDQRLKTESQYLKYIKISFPIITVILLAYFYRIWTRSHEKKRGVKRKPKAETKTERFETAEPEEKHEEVLEVQELEKEKTDDADGKTEVTQQDPIDHQDPSHPGYITPVVRRKVWIRNKGQCVACGSRQDLQYDYIVPVSEGGSNTLDNLQLLCQTCSQEKSN